MNPACSAFERAGDKLLAGKERALGLGPLQKAGEGREVSSQEAKQREEGASLCSPCGWSYKGLREMDKEVVLKIVRETWCQNYMEWVTTREKTKVFPGDQT